MPETITIPGHPALVAIARNGTRALLPDAPMEVREDAELIVSELATNAVLWSRSGQGGSIDITIDHEPGSSMARIEVADDGKRLGDQPDVLDPDPAQHGRGLIITARLAKDWGHRTDKGRGIYWAVVAWG